VEFFLDMLRIGTKDERAYKKIAETQVLPLIASIGSSIDREHFITIVSQRLEVPEAAVRAEVAKRPVATAEDTSLDVHKGDAELSLTPLERVAGMLLSHAQGNTWLEGKVEAVLTQERVTQIKEKLEPHMERLRFELEAQGEDMEAVAQNLLNTLEQAVLGERISALQKSIMSARSSGESTHDMTKELQGLKLREEALRK
jgi:cell division FtsZ-interacting protein ZapD